MKPTSYVCDENRETMLGPTYREALGQRCAWSLSDAQIRAALAVGAAIRSATAQ